MVSETSTPATIANLWKDLYRGGLTAAFSHRQPQPRGGRRLYSPVRPEDRPRSRLRTHASSNSASSVSSRPPSPSQALPCMQASFIGLAADRVAMSERTFFVCE
jgi:hypothetical protein